MIKIFTGFDAREAAGWNAFVDSVYAYASVPVTIARLPERQGDGSNRFTFSRFMVPELCEHKGWGLYCDGADMLLRADIAELWALRDEKFAVQVVQHSYTTKFPRKYLGTPMESANIDYPRKNWSSVILWNCGHWANRAQWGNLHRFEWLEDELIGALPVVWNWLADEAGYNPKAKLWHFTAGMPVQALHLTQPEDLLPVYSETEVSER
jgi:hypothetical protein